MSASVHSIEEDVEIWDAVDLMLRSDVKRLPVTRAGRLVGIVTRHDLLKCIAARRHGAPGAPA